MAEPTVASTPEESARQRAVRDDKRKFIMWVALCGLIFFGLFLGVAHFSKAPKVGSANAATILALITAAAVGIERALEMGWTIVGQMKNSWWPMNAIGKQINKLVDDLDNKLDVPFKEVEQVIAKLKAGNDTAEAVAIRLGVTLDKAKELVKEADELALKWGVTTINEAIRLAENAQSEFTLARNQLLDQRGRATSSQQVNLLAASAWQSVQYLDALLPNVLKKIEATEQAIVGVSDFVATFKDNPGRRLLSIYLGAIIGMVVAGMVGLDVFQAVAADTSSGGTVAAKIVLAGATTVAQPEQGSFLAKLFPYLGVAATGLLMGLGSSPTHEVIQSLKEYKKSRASVNDPNPQTSGRPVGESDDVMSVTGLEAMNLGTAAGGRRARRKVSTFSLR